MLFLVLFSKHFNIRSLPCVLLAWLHKVLKLSVKSITNTHKLKLAHLWQLLTVFAGVWRCKSQVQYSTHPRWVLSTQNNGRESNQTEMFHVCWFRCSHLHPRLCARWFAYKRERSRKPALAQFRVQNLTIPLTRSNKFVFNKSLTSPFFFNTQTVSDGWYDLYPSHPMRMNSFPRLLIFLSACI